MTRREQIIQALAQGSKNPTQLANMFDTSKKEIMEDLKHIAKTVKAKGKTLVVKLAECNKCGFVMKKFGTKCPECRSEDIQEPMYSILN